MFICLISPKGFSGLIGRMKGTKGKSRQSSERSSVDLISSKQLGNETTTNLINNAKPTKKQQQLIADTECKQAAPSKLTINATKINPINNITSCNISPKRESSNKSDYHKNSEPVIGKESITPLDSKKQTETSNGKDFESRECKGKQIKSIPSKLIFSEPVDTIYQFPEPNAQNKSSPIGGILTSEQIKQFVYQSTETNCPPKPKTDPKPKELPTTKLLNAAEVSARPRSSLLFTRRQKYKKMDRGLETINRLILSVVGQTRGNCVIKSTPITDDYTIGSNVLGLGINGKVVECVRKVKPNDNSANHNKKCALKVLKDNAKSRREIDLHWKASNCKHIVNIMDVYENTYSGNKCLLVVMEW